MATAKKETPETPETPKNVYQKLSIVRALWLGVDIKKSGVNKHAEFTYFELEDIIPEATAILSKQHCLFLVSFPEGRAIGEFVDTDTGEKITFEAPFTLIADPAKFRMNEVQGAGAAVTYYRRYLYALMLDLIDPDKIDAPLPLKPETPHIPATPEQREEITETLTDKNAPADELQIKSLRASCKRLLALAPEEEETIQNLVLKTENFTTLTKENAQIFLTSINAQIAEKEANS